MIWAQKRGYQVYVWTVDDPIAAERLVNLGVQGIITNEPGFVNVIHSQIS